MRRGVGLQAVLDVVDDVGRGEHDLLCEVAQRHVQHQRIVVENHDRSLTCGALATVAKTTKSLDRINCSTLSCTVIGPAVPDRSK
jgi:hypothetical protein